MKRYLVLAMLVPFLVLPGCAGGRGEAFQPSVLQPDQAVIYIFRLSSSRLRKKPVQVFVNQTALGDLNPGEYTERVVPPGEYLVRVESDSSMVRRVRLIPGDVVYLQITTVGLNKKPVMETPESDLARRLIAGMTRAQP